MDEGPSKPKEGPSSVGLTIQVGNTVPLSSLGHFMHRLYCTNKACCIHSFSIVFLFNTVSPFASSTLQRLTFQSDAHRRPTVFSSSSRYRTIIISLAIRVHMYSTVFPFILTSATYSSISINCPVFSPLATSSISALATYVQNYSVFPLAISKSLSLPAPTSYICYRTVSHQSFY